MPQSLLIFRKDLLHLWPETLLNLVLFAAFAWSAPSGWQQSEYAAYASVLSLILKLLLPIAWIVLISRLIHDEPLVGDRQFWTSRPYHWAKLLAAKALYIGVFVYLPFLLMQVYLLKHAGLYPTTVLPALLHNLLLLTVVIIVPVAAIAAVTATFARLFLSIIGAIIYGLVVFGASVYLVLRNMPPPQLKPIFITILIALPALVLVYQYATRKTANARIALIATPLLVLLLLLVTPSSALIRAAYPMGKAPAEVKLSPFPEAARPKAPDAGRLETLQSRVLVGFPFAVTGIDKDSQYAVDGASVTLDGNGVHYVSPYGEAGAKMNAAQAFSSVTLPIPQEVFDKLKGPVDVHLSLAVEHFVAQPVSTWRATLLPFDVPGHGNCSYPPNQDGGDPVCHYPFATPELNFVTAAVTPGGCTSGGPTMPARGLVGGGLHLSLLDLDPVITTPLHLQTGSQTVNGSVCPGAALNFIEAKAVGKMGMDVTDKQVVLENYAVHVRPQTSGPQGMQRQPMGQPE